MRNIRMNIALLSVAFVAVLAVASAPVIAAQQAPPQTGQAQPAQQNPAPKAPAPNAQAPNAQAPAEKAPDAPAPAPNAAAAAPLEGDLLRVDGEAKKLAIKTAEGKEVEFSYNDKTEIAGAKDGAAGLANMKDSRVAVTFTEDAQSKAKTATKIEVKPKQ